MKGYLTMSQKERQRYLVLDRVVREEIRLSDAVKVLGISYRQGQRVLRAYRVGGETALVHGLRGREGTRRCAPDFKAKVLDAYRSQYPDFGPTLASEKLAELDGLTVHPETLRLWLIAEGVWTVKKRRCRHRSRRKRRERFGELIQLDGSHHDWFEGRGPKCCLITLVDDATGRTYLLFAANEGVFAVMAAVLGWIRLYGIPEALYTDRLGTYLTDREPTVAEQLAGEEPVTQFGRACRSVGVRIIAAHSPQAKGRVENKHGLTQDRLVKEMRLAGIDNIADANAFLATWLPGINERFNVLPIDPSDAHRPVPDNLDLDAVFCRHSERAVGNDWVVRYNNRYLQIAKQPGLPPSGSAVLVREWEDGRLQLSYRDRQLRHAALDSRPERPKPEKAAKASRPVTPASDHPWRNSGKPAQDANPRREQIERMASHYLGDVPPTFGARNVTLGGGL